MNRNLASTLSVVSTAAAAFAFAAIASGNAYAENISEYTTPFASTKTRAEVQAEVMGHAEQLRLASSEWALQMNQPVPAHTGYTRAQATAEYLANRDEVNALTSEDSGSSYLAARARHTSGVMMAGSDH